MPIKLKYFLKLIILVVISVTVIFSASCKEKDGSGFLFRYSLLNDPEILDPQIASDESSLTVIKNIYAGLLDVTELGELTEGIAESYDTSNDGITYMFSLKKGYYWTSADDYKAEVTANDFVFAFERIFNPFTKSPYTNDFICIKNAQKILNGELNYNEIGVYAVSDYELRIELEYPNANFLSLMTSSAAMPCNEEFFNNAKGKYGLETKQTPSNSAFYIKQWEYDPYGRNNYLILRKNKYYSELNKVYPSSLNFFIEKDKAKIKSDFLSGATDCAVLQGNTKEIFKSSYINNVYQSVSSGIVFNLNSDIFINQTFRKALCLSIDRSKLNNILPNGVVPAYALVPSGVTMLNKSYRELVSENNISVYNSVAAKEQWHRGLDITERFTIDNIKIMVPQSYYNADALKFITQQWQNELGFFCGVEVVSDKEYQQRLSGGDYEIALYTLECRYNSPISVLNNFYSNSSSNRISYKNGIVDALIEKAMSSKTLNESVDTYAKAEKEIIDNFVYIPIFYENDYLVYGKDIEGIIYNPFTNQVDFKNAKNFD